MIVLSHDLSGFHSVVSCPESNHKKITKHNENEHKPPTPEPHNDVMHENLKSSMM